MASNPTVTEVAALLANANPAALDELLARFADDPRAGVRTACQRASGKRQAACAEVERTALLYLTESRLQDQGCFLVAGVDEVGRGALAGPLTAAAVILPVLPRLEGLDDSKRLSPHRREEVAARVRSIAVGIGVAHVSPLEIDALGMTAALRRAVTLAIAQLGVVPDHVVLDGLPLHIANNETAVVKGDSKVAAIAAASIVAKVTRDALMRLLAAEHPEYAFDVNKGYGTSDHLAAIARMGLCPIHRRSFSIAGQSLSLF